MEMIIFTGVQASGKSSFYKENFLKTHVRINLDMLKTRTKENILLEACVKAKIPVVIDNTNLTKELRKKYIDIAKSAGYTIISYFFPVTKEVAIEHNSTRLDKECVPKIAIYTALKKLQSPEKNEGFDKLYTAELNNNNFKIEELV